jgi:hypothetical protein
MRVSKFEWIRSYGRLIISEKIKEFWKDIKQKNTVTEYIT